MTRGRMALLDVLRRTRAEYVARRCKVTRATVYHWASGRRTPSEAKKKTLGVNYAIPPESWGERAE